MCSSKKLSSNGSSMSTSMLWLGLYLIANEIVQFNVTEVICMIEAVELVASEVVMLEAVAFIDNEKSSNGS